MESMPTKTTYIQNYENLDLSGAKITATYDNGTTGLIDVTNEMISGFDNSRVGENTVTVTYQGKTCTFTVNIVEKSITGIEISKLPDMVKFVKDFGILDTAGGKIKVTFDDESEAIVDMTKEMVSGFDNSQVGTQTLTVTYQGHSADYEVEVIDAVITKITMQSLPTKTTYIQNYEDLDITGAKLAVVFNGAYTNVINVLDEMVSGFDNRILGKNTLTVKYADKETTFDVTIVKHTATKIELVSKPTKLQYKVGEKLDLTGGKIKVFYNDETSEVLDMTESMLKGNVSLDTVGSKLITLKVDDQETSFEVTVTAADSNNPGNGNNNGGNNGNNNNNNGGSNNGNNNNGGTNQDTTIANKDIPQTGVNPGVTIGITALTAVAGVGLLKIFKYKDIK